MPEPDVTDEVTPAPDGQAVARRRALIVSSIVAALVLGSMVWGGTTAMQAVAAEREREAQRVSDLGLLLDERSEASELLAVSKSLVSSFGDRDDATRTALELELLERTHGELVDELARVLAGETPHGPIIAQSRLLQNTVDDLTSSIDIVTRSAVKHARTVRDAAPLATAPTLATLDEAVASLAVVRQGLPSSYSGRGALVTALLDASEAVTASHAAEKAEKERLEAERRAAEEAARRASFQRTPPKPPPLVVWLWCGVDEFGEIFYCPYEV